MAALDIPGHYEGIGIGSRRNPLEYFGVIKDGVPAKMLKRIEAIPSVQDELAILVLDHGNLLEQAILPDVFGKILYLAPRHHWEKVGGGMDGEKVTPAFSWERGVGGCGHVAFRE
jgi:hypothetical protein